MTTLAVISSVYGDFDRIDPPTSQATEVEWVLVTDRPHNVDGWREVIEPRPHLHPRLAAKHAKCRPDAYTRADIIIWLDGSARLIHDHAAAELAGFVEPRQPVAMWTHPDRSTLTAEAAVSKQMSKYQGQNIDGQVAHYLDAGHPDGFGLWATGAIVYRRLGPQCWGDAWLHEQTRWTYQDQLSWPVVLRAYQRAHPVELPGKLWNNPHVTFVGHDRED